MKVIIAIVVVAIVAIVIVEKAFEEPEEHATHELNTMMSGQVESFSIGSFLRGIKRKIGGNTTTADTEPNRQDVIDYISTTSRAPNPLGYKTPRGMDRTWRRIYKPKPRKMNDIARFVHTRENYTFFPEFPITYCHPQDEICNHARRLEQTYFIPKWKAEQRRKLYGYNDNSLSQLNFNGKLYGFPDSYY